MLETSHSRHSQPAGLAQELVEIILSFLIYDIIALLTCSTTCYSWYIAAVPHLRYSLTTDESRYWRYEKLYNLPRPLQESHKLGLLPFVRRFSVRACVSPSTEFTPKWLGRRSLGHFSAPKNLQELGIDHLQLSSFMPNMNRYFGHLAPTLRFLALAWANGSSRQILYFIGLFPNLQDLKLIYPHCRSKQEYVDDATLVPLSVPPLQGRLSLTSITGDKFVMDMIALFGGLRFRHMELFAVECARLLLRTCAKILDTLRLYPTDPLGMFFLLFLGEGTSGLRLVLHSGRPRCRLAFDLSRNKSLRTLETTAASITAEGAAPNFLTVVLSTITSPLPLDAIIDYDDVDVDLVRASEGPRIFACLMTLKDAITENALGHEQRFKLFQGMYRVREFRLVLYADVPNHAVGPAVQTLERLVRAEKEKGRLGYLRREPLIISEKRTPHTGYDDDKICCERYSPVISSAL